MSANVALASVESEELRLAAADGLSLAATAYRPQGEAKRGVVIVNSATSVHRRFYSGFAEFLAGNGYRTITYDYRGVGDSLSGSVRESKASMHDWGRLDFTGIFEEVGKKYPGEPIYVVGHSIGGQVVGLAPNAARIAGLTLIAAQSGYWGWWPFPLRYAMAVLWTAFIPGVTTALSYYPAARLGRGEDLPPGVALEWARWCRSPEFFVDPAGQRLETRFADVRAPVLAYSFTDDLFAPPKAVDALVGLFANARVDRRRVTPKSIGVDKIGHFGFFRQRVGGGLWQDVATWFDRN